MQQRTGFFLAAFSMLVSALAFQSCLTDTGGDDSGDYDGKWFLTREIVSVTANGNTVADTVKADTGTFGRSFLLIQGSTFKFVNFDALFDSMDTLQLDIQSLGGGKWLLDGDTVTVTRSGKLLRFTLSASGGYSEITEFTAYTGAFPPAEWAAAAGSGSIPQVWLAWRDILSWSDGFSTDVDTMLYDTADALSHFFFRFSGDTIYEASAGSTRVLATERIDASRWLIAPYDEDDEEDGADTLTITRTGNRLVARASTYDAQWDEHIEQQTDFVAYTGVYPPAAWANLMVDEPNNTAAQATPIIADAAARSAFLGEADADWYSFTAQAGKRYRIRTFGSTDTYLRLYGTNGATLLDEQDDDADLNAVITWTAPTSGTYYFSVRGFGDEVSGGYTVSVVEQGMQAGEVEPNNTSAQANAVTVGAEALSGSLSNNDADWYSFTATNGVAYRLRTYGATDTYMRIYATNGSTLLDEEDDDTDVNPNIVWTAPSTGTYYFSVRGFSDSQSGTYAVDVQLANSLLPKKSVKDGKSGKQNAHRRF
jgi:hypothetical protein